MDLVVFVTPELHDLLASLSESKDCIRFGKLNLLCCTHLSAYGVWKDGTRQLTAQAPVTREEAVDLFRRLRSEAGVSMTEISAPEEEDSGL